jgi:site-specific recombinase XerD
MYLLRIKEKKNMDLDSLVADFLEYLEVEKGCSLLTARAYKRYLKRFCTWFYENNSSTSPEDIDFEAIRRYRLYLAHFRSPGGAQLKRTSQSYYIIALRSFLRYLVVKRDIKTISPDKIELPKQGSRSVSFLDAGQMERLLNSPKISNITGLRDRVILETLFSTGLRVSELVNLNRDEIDLKRKEFSIRGKGNKIRVVFLSDTAAYWIERYLQERQDNFRPLFIRYSGRVNTWNSGEKMRLTARFVQKIVAKYATRCGLSLKVSPHTMRHSFATDLLINGADIRSVQEMLGHESIKTTQVYTHVTNRHLKEVHQAFHHRTE